MALATTKSRASLSADKSRFNEHEWERGHGRKNYYFIGPFFCFPKRQKGKEEGQKVEAFSYFSTAASPGGKPLRAYRWNGDKGTIGHPFGFISLAAP